MKTKKEMIIHAFALILSVIMLLPALVACRDRDNETLGDLLDNPDGELSVRVQVECTPLIGRDIQFANGFIYFAGSNAGLFKYDPTTDTVSEICSDPLCDHMGTRDSSCNFGKRKSLGFRAFSNVVIYHALARVEGEDMAKNRLFSYDPIKMKNIMIDKNPSTVSTSRIGNRYYYSENITVKEENGEKVNYTNLRQLDLFTGEEIIFGNAVKGNTPEYRIIGAIDGNIYANNTQTGGVYICPESEPGNFRKLRDSSMGYVFVSEKDIFFKSADPESGKEYYYHTDMEGNELVGGMQWGSIYDGRYLYYIPSEEVEFQCGDGSVQPIHSREIYKLDMETGEQTVAFTFSGQYETMGLVKGDRLFMVHDNKLYTNQIAEYNFTRGTNDPSKTTIYGEGITLKDGMIIVDLGNGDITHVTADYKLVTGGNEFIHESVLIEMDLEGEK